MKNLVMGYSAVGWLMASLIPAVATAQEDISSQSAQEVRQQLNAVSALFQEIRRKTAA
ncbi:MAG TPA: hypothetical protein VEK33_09280 [Terriglobales bacterium]|nr:hypothetical protein [Terriglobales bacterium]